VSYSDVVKQFLCNELGAWYRKECVGIFADKLLYFKRIVTTGRYNVVLMMELSVDHEADAEAEAGCDDGSPSSLDMLQLKSALPDHSEEELEELLMLCNGDVDSVFEMLTS